MAAKRRTTVGRKATTKRAARAQPKRRKLSRGSPVLTRALSERMFGGGARIHFEPGPASWTSRAISTAFPQTIKVGDAIQVESARHSRARKAFVNLLVELGIARRGFRCDETLAGKDVENLPSKFVSAVIALLHSYDYDRAYERDRAREQGIDERRS